MSSTAPSFVFGPRDRRGFILGLRGGQLAIVIAGGLTALGLIMAAPGTLLMLVPIVLVLALSMVAVVLPIGGRGVDEWVAVLIRFLLGGGRDWRSPLPHEGRLIRVGRGGEVALLPQPTAFPSVLRDCALLAVAVPQGHLGMFRDRRRGTYTAVIRVRDTNTGSAFGLLDATQKGQRMAAWGDAIDTLARHGSPIQAVQLVVRTAEADPSPLVEYLEARASEEMLTSLRAGDQLASPLLRSYLSTLDDTIRVTRTQHVYLALQIGQARGRRAIREAGGGDRGAGAVLADSVLAFQRQLAAAGIGVDGALPPRLLARVLREAWDPIGTGCLAEDAVDPADSGPLVAIRSWRSYLTDSGCRSVSWWISEWPRTPVGPNYLVPLLLETNAPRMTFSLTLAPVDPARARSEVEAAMTDHDSDEELRTRHGFRSTIDRRRQVEAVARREAELADRHTDCRFTGHITAYADSDAELRRAGEEVTARAIAAGLVLRRMDGEHDLGFSYSLPLARGLW